MIPRRIWPVLALLFLADAAHAATLEYAKVIEVSGTAKIKNAAQQSPVNLTANKFFKKSDTIETGQDSFVEISFDHALERAARLSQNSQVEVSEAPNSFSLKKGSFIIMLEQESSPEKDEGVYIRTKHLILRLAVGGVIITANENSSVVKVFSETAEIASIHTPENFRSVPEGFKCVIRDSGRHTERMDFKDYAFWQAWIKKHYLKKDDWNEKKLEKEFNL